MPSGQVHDLDLTMNPKVHGSYNSEMLVLNFN